MKNCQNLARKKIAKWPKSNKISLDPTRSRPYSARTSLDLAKSCRIQIDLLEKILVFTGKHKWVSRFGFFGFERRKFDIRLADLRFWRKKSVADLQRNWFGQQQVGFSWRRRVGQVRRVLEQPYMQSLFIGDIYQLDMEISNEE